MMLTQSEVVTWSSELFQQKNSILSLYKKYHPDKQGGSHDQFIILRQILDAFHLYEPRWQTEMKTCKDVENLFVVCKLAQRAPARPSFTPTSSFTPPPSTQFIPPTPRFNFTKLQDDWYKKWKATFDANKPQKTPKKTTTKKETSDVPRKRQKYDQTTSSTKSPKTLVCGYQPCSKQFVKFAKHNKFCSSACRKSHTASLYVKKKPHFEFFV